MVFYFCSPNCIRLVYVRYDSPFFRKYFKIPFSVSLVCVSTTWISFTERVVRAALWPPLLCKYRPGSKLIKKVTVVTLKFCLSLPAMYTLGDHDHWQFVTLLILDKLMWHRPFLYVDNNVSEEHFNPISSVVSRPTKLRNYYNPEDSPQIPGPVNLELMKFIV